MTTLSKLHPARARLASALVLLALAVGHARAQDDSGDPDPARPAALGGPAAAAESWRPRLALLGPFEEAAKPPGKGPKPVPKPAPGLPGKPGDKPAKPAPQTRRWTISGLMVDGDHILTSLRGLGRTPPDAIPIESPTGRLSSATIVGKAPHLDLVLLRSPGLAPRLTPLQAKAVETEPGRLTVAVGRAPLSTAPAVQRGMVSATGRFRAGLLQTDARTHLGSLGSALVDRQGRLLGLVVRARPQPQDGAGVTFAVPTATLLEVLPRLRAGETLEPPPAGFLGIYVAARRGPPVLTRVVEGSPAARAGWKAGDILLELGGRELSGVKALVATLRETPPGRPLAWLIKRDKERRRGELTPSRAPESPTSKPAKAD